MWVREGATAFKATFKGLIPILSSPVALLSGMFFRSSTTCFKLICGMWNTVELLMRLSTKSVSCWFYLLVSTTGITVSAFCWILVKCLWKVLAILVGSQTLLSSASMNERLEGADLVGEILWRVFQSSLDYSYFWRSHYSHNLSWPWQLSLPLGYVIFCTLCMQECLIWHVLWTGLYDT